MSKVLYITAHPYDETQSYSMAVGKTFINSYRKVNPHDEVVHVDLFKENIPQIDADVLKGWEKLRSGTAFDALSVDEKAKVSRLAELNEQFIKADKYVFVTPLWNLSFPPVVKAYVDALAVAGKTFKYTEQGPIGLLIDKKVIHIQARGGVYAEGPAADLEMGHRYLNLMMNFFGISSIEGLFIEGHMAAPNKAEEIKDYAVKRAKVLAQTF